MNDNNILTLAVGVMLIFLCYSINETHDHTHQIINILCQDAVFSASGQPNFEFEREIVCKRNP